MSTRVVVHPADFGGCGHYRLIWIAEALAAQGHDVRLEHDYSYRAVFQDTIQGPTLRHLDETVDADVVVLQRPLHRNRYELIGALQAQGVAVVVEIDDDFHAIHPRNPAWKGANPLNDPDVHRDWLMRSCARADLVTCTTPALAARYGAHGRVAVLDNYVPQRYTQIERGEHDGTVVGWSGSVHTHPGDLDVTGGGVAEAIRSRDAILGVVGTGAGVGEALGYDAEIRRAGWVAIEKYPDALATFDVGIVPLKAGAFNDAKSHLKGLEYAAVGVPFVATPTGPYRELAKRGIGWLADSPAEWRYLVSALIQDHDHREAMALEWRQRVADHWTVEANAFRWAQAWERAHDRRKVAA